MSVDCFTDIHFFFFVCASIVFYEAAGRVRIVPIPRIGGDSDRRLTGDYCNKNKGGWIQNESNDLRTRFQRGSRAGQNEKREKIIASCRATGHATGMRWVWYERTE